MNGTQKGAHYQHEAPAVAGWQLLREVAESVATGDSSEEAARLFLAHLVARKNEEIPSIEFMSIARL